MPHALVGPDSATSLDVHLSVGERAKRHSQVCSIKIRDKLMYTSKKKALKINANIEDVALNEY